MSVSNPCNEILLPSVSYVDKLPDLNIGISSVTIASNTVPISSVCCLDNETFIQKFANFEIEVDVYPHAWHSIQVGSNDPYLVWDGQRIDAKALTDWLYSTFGRGVIVQGVGYTDLSPANVSWVFYDLNFMGTHMVVKFRHNWQKIQFVLYWGELQLHDL